MDVMVVLGCEVRRQVVNAPGNVLETLRGCRFAGGVIRVWRWRYQLDIDDRTVGQGYLPFQDYHAILNVSAVHHQICLVV
jgi:hypothetical protein